MSFLRRVSFTQWMVVAMVVGIAIGIFAPATAVALKPVSTVFLRLIKSLIVPLLFSTLVVGIAGHGDDLKQVGRLAFRSILYFEVVTTLALAVGLLAVNLVKPGVGVGLDQASTEAGTQFAGKQQTFASMIEHTFPQSFFEAAASNEVLQVVVFAIIFAIALARTPAKPRATMLGVLDALAEVMFKYTGIVMALAPFAIGAAMAVTVGQSGVGVLRSLGLLVLTLYGALAVFIVCVLVPIALIARVPLREFIRTVREPALIAFTTASSEAALPRAMQVMERFGVPKRVVAFVLPTGYSFNLDGSTLYLALASVFVAQAAGINMPLSQQLLMMLTLMLTSKGVAAVPRASLVILSGTLASFGLPLQGVAVILGVDALMDMARTSVNLVGNCLASAVMSRWEGNFRSEQPDAVEGAGGVVPAHG